jgi:hypothetical protein
MWEYDAFHDSIIVAGNGGIQPVQARFTLYYNRGTERYDIEQAVQPDDEMWVDVGQLIRNQVPDRNGNRLPSDLTDGSYEISDLSHRGAGTMFEGKIIYDKMYGSVAYGCAACCGYGTTTSFWYDPLGILDGSTAVQGVQAPDECAGGVLADISDSFYGNWSTSAPSIVTADYYGTHTAVAVGSTRSNTSGYFNDNNPRLGCPRWHSSPSGNDSVYSLTCTSVTRGQTTTCTVNGPSGATYSGWKFQDGAGNTVASSNTASTWSGVAVQSGTVSVTVTSGSGGGHNQTKATGALTVSARSGWAFNPATSNRIANGSACDGTTLSVVSTPVPNARVGESDAYSAAQWTGQQIGGDGPNTGYAYATSPSDQSQYCWVISNDVDNSTSAFYQAQCGNWNGTSGYISGPTLDADDQRHEGGSVNSHYAEYVSAVQSNNIGTLIESFVEFTNPSNFNTDLSGRVSNMASTIAADAAPEPCGTQNVNYNAACVFDGNINFGPNYASCH